jgi:plastocyanin
MFPPRSGRALVPVLALATMAAGWLLPRPARAAAFEVQVVDDTGKPLPDAVVFLESREARAAVKPISGIEIAQAARQFTPQVTVVPVGSSVTFPNRDTVRHHVYSFSDIKKFEIKLYVGTPSAPVVFDQPGIAVLGCNIHDRMAAWVLVVNTPWYGTTAANGVHRWAQIPAGSYQLRSWHATLPVGAPAAEQTVKVDAAAQTVVVKLQGTNP